MDYQNWINKGFPDNNIILADCMVALKNLPDESVDFICSDIPYGIEFLSGHSCNHQKIVADGFEEWQEHIKVWLPEFKRLIKPQGVVALFSAGGGRRPTTAILTLEAIKHFNLINTLVWRKFIGMGWRYRAAYENILILSKDRDNYNFFDTSNACANVIEGINQEIPAADDHPTHKPEALMRHLIKIHSEPNHLILDPFAGGGSTLVAAKQLNRRFLGFEIEPKYYKIAKDRLSQHTLFAFEEHKAVTLLEVENG